jgi:PAS domain S-box-containing protein
MLRRRAEREVERIFDLSLDLMASAGFDGYFKRVNPAFERTLGYSSQELLSRPFTDFVHPDDLKSTEGVFAGLVTGKEQAVEFENRYVCADGSVRWLQWNTRVLPGEGVMYGVARDVTDSRRVEREFEEVFNLSPDLICIAGLDGYFKRVNPAFEEAFGYSSEELLSRPLVEFGHPEDRAFAREALAKLARGEEVPRFENRNIRADGSILWLEWSCRALPEEGIVYGAARDVTDRKRADAELREAQQTVEMSRAELAASRARVVTASAEERRRVVRDLHDGAQQRLVHSVITLKLALRGLRTGDRHAEEFVSEALDHAEQANSELRELVHGILPGVLTSGGLSSSVEELATRATLPVAVDVSKDRFPPDVEATAYFVVSEALTNAVKHSRAEGVRIAARVDNGALRVVVHDDGIGGADPSRGSGLTGLRDRVEALSGTIEIASPAGSGTSLVAEIPIDG